MRNFIDIVELNESQIVQESIQNFDGLWVDSNGDVLECDLDDYKNHAELARGFFGEDDDELDDEDALSTAFDEGWIRVGIIGPELFVEWRDTVDPDAIKGLVRTARTFPDDKRTYTLNAAGDCEQFSSKRELLVAIARARDGLGGR